MNYSCIVRKISMSISGLAVRGPLLILAAPLLSSPDDHAFQRKISNSEYLLWWLHEDVATPHVYSGYRYGNKKSGVKTPPHAALEIEVLLLFKC